MTLDGKTAVVTGGAAGIGYAISERLARDGADVAIFDIDPAAGGAAAERIREATGRRAVAHRVDVADRAEIDAAVARVHEELGPISILVNNAGIELFAPFTETDLASWNRIMAVNLTGTYQCTQAVLPDMLAAGWGRIVNVTSSSAQRGSRNMTAYSASKGAVISFTRSLALELGRHGITVNNVPPGFIETPMLHKSIQAGRLGPGGLDGQIEQTPVGRAGRPEDIAAMCAFLASPDAGYITGQTFGVNGGRVPS